MIRDFKPDDLPAIQDIAEAAWKEIFDGFREQLGEEIFRQIRPDPSGQKRQQIAEAARRIPGQILICELDGKIAGFLVYQLNPENRVGIIGNNAASLEFRGRGVGRALYEAAFERFTAADMSIAQVQTGLDDAHAPARRAYEHAGFQVHLDSVTYYKKLV